MNWHHSLPAQVASICDPGKQFPLKAKKWWCPSQGGKSTVEWQIKGHLLLLCYSRDWFLLKTHNRATCNYIRCFSIWKTQHKQNFHLWMFKKALKIQIILCLKGVLSLLFGIFILLNRILLFSNKKPIKTHRFCLKLCSHLISQRFSNSAWE